MVSFYREVLEEDKEISLVMIMAFSPMYKEVFRKKAHKKIQTRTIKRSTSTAKARNQLLPSKYETSRENLGRALKIKKVI